MLNSLIKELTIKLTDWLIALCGVSFVIWFGITQPVFSNNHNVDLPTIDNERLKQHVHQLTGVFAPRTIEYDNLMHAGNYIFSEFNKLGNTQYQKLHSLTGKYSNVILQLGPDSKEMFVIGAHFDAKNSSLDTEGNASGVATLIELARYLSKNEDKLPIRVQLVAYPLSQSNSISIVNMGSFYHADSLLKSGKTVKLMVSLDSVGCFNDESGSQQHPYNFMNLLYPDKGNYISLVSRLQDYSQLRALKKSFVGASSLPLYSFNTPQNFSSLGSSDHRNFWRKGFPAILITDTAEYRKANANGVRISRQLDYHKMAMLVQGLYQVVMESESIQTDLQLVQNR